LLKKDLKAGKEGEFKHGIAAAPLSLEQWVSQDEKAFQNMGVYMIHQVDTCFDHLDKDLLYI